MPHILRALYSYEGGEEGDELTFKEDELFVLKQKNKDDDDDDEWILCSKLDQPDVEGLVPANYVDELEIVCELRALFDYQSREDNELDITKGDLLSLLEELDSDWSLVKNSLCDMGIVPSTYVEKVSTNQQEKPNVWALYDFQSDEKDELSLKQGDKAILLDSESSEDWWLVSFQDREGLVPSTYLSYSFVGAAFAFDNNDDDGAAAPLSSDKTNTIINDANNSNTSEKTDKTETIEKIEKTTSFRPQLPFVDEISKESLKLRPVPTPSPKIPPKPIIASLAPLPSLPPKVNHSPSLPKTPSFLAAQSPKTQTTETPKLRSTGLLDSIKSTSSPSSSLDKSTCNSILNTPNISPTPTKKITSPPAQIVLKESLKSPVTHEYVKPVLKKTTASTKLLSPKEELFYTPALRTSITPVLKKTFDQSSGSGTAAVGNNSNNNSSNNGNNITSKSVADRKKSFNNNEFNVDDAAKKYPSLSSLSTLKSSTKKQTPKIPPIQQQHQQQQHQHQHQHQHQQPLKNSAANLPLRKELPSLEDCRTWKDKSGSFETEASFQSLLDGKVKLWKMNGKTIQVHLSSLSQGDVAYVHHKMTGEPLAKTEEAMNGVVSSGKTTPPTTTKTKITSLSSIPIIKPTKPVPRKVTTVTVETVVKPIESYSNISSQRSKPTSPKFAPIHQVQQQQRQPVYYSTPSYQGPPPNQYSVPPPPPPPAQYNYAVPAYHPQQQQGPPPPPQSYGYQYGSYQQQGPPPPQQYASYHQQQQPPPPPPQAYGQQQPYQQQPYQQQQPYHQQPLQQPPPPYYDPNIYNRQQ